MIGIPIYIKVNTFFFLWCPPPGRGGSLACGRSGSAVGGRKCGPKGRRPPRPPATAHSDACPACPWVAPKQAHRPCPRARAAGDNLPRRRGATRALPPAACGRPAPAASPPPPTCRCCTRRLSSHLEDASRANEAPPGLTLRATSAASRSLSRCARRSRRVLENWADGRMGESETEIEEAHRGGNATSTATHRWSPRRLGLTEGAAALRGALPRAPSSGRGWRRQRRRAPPHVVARVAQRARLPRDGLL